MKDLTGKTARSDPAGPGISGSKGRHLHQNSFVKEISQILSWSGLNFNLQASPQPTTVHVINQPAICAPPHLHVTQTGDGFALELRRYHGLTGSNERPQMHRLMSMQMSASSRGTCRSPPYCWGGKTPSGHPQKLNSLEA